MVTLPANAPRGARKHSKLELRQQLRESMNRYELVAKATNDVIYDLDLNAGTVVWNDALYTQYGYKRSEPAGTLEWWAAHIHSDDAERFENEISRLLDSGEATWDTEYRFRKADGKYAVVRDRAFVWRDDRGEPQRIIGSFLDITKQHELDRAKDEFISLVSHQLRTPLTIIRWVSEMLGSGMAGTLNPMQAEQTQKITDASIRLIKLVGNILNISRVELDRIKIEPIMLDPNTIIQIYVDELKPLAIAKDVTLDFKPHRRLGRAPLDPTVFGQIVQNLISNAIHYTRTHKGHIEIRFTKQARGYLLQVRDNGIGIPRAAQPHIFERFYRAPNTSRVEGEGTGLGLYLVKLITDAIGGKAWFESVAGKGTTFYVLIPPDGMQPKSGERKLE